MDSWRTGHIAGKIHVLTPQNKISSFIFDYSNYVAELFDILTPNREKVKLIFVIIFRKTSYLFDILLMCLKFRTFF